MEWVDYDERRQNGSGVDSGGVWWKGGEHCGGGVI